MTPVMWKDLPPVCQKTANLSAAGLVAGSGKQHCHHSWLCSHQSDVALNISARTCLSRSRLCAESKKAAHPWVQHSRCSHNHADCSSKSLGHKYRRLQGLLAPGSVWCRLQHEDHPHDRACRSS